MVLTNPQSKTCPNYSVCQQAQFELGGHQIQLSQITCQLTCQITGEIDWDYQTRSPYLAGEDAAEAIGDTYELVLDDNWFDREALNHPEPEELAASELVPYWIRPDGALVVGWYPRLTGYEAEYAALDLWNTRPEVDEIAEIVGWSPAQVISRYSERDGLPGIETPLCCFYDRENREMEDAIAPEPDNSLERRRELMHRSTVEIHRLGWNTRQCRAELRQLTGKASRLLLLDREFEEFIEYLKSIPTPNR